MNEHEQLETILAAWNVGLVLAAARPADGTIHQTWLLRTPFGRFALKGYRYQERSPIEREHALIAFVAARDTRAIAPLPLPDGATVLADGGQFFALFPHAPGQQCARAALGPNEHAAMGRSLAQLHHILAAYPTEHVARRVLLPDTAATFAALADLEAHIRAKDALDETDHIVLVRLASRRAWLEQHAADAAPRMHGLPWQAIHGDYQEANLFFAGGDVSAIIDWDQAYAAPRAWEVARTLHLALKFDPHACRAFLAAYRALLPLAPHDLDAAMRCYAWMRAHDLWVYQALYLEGNQRVRRYIEPGVFRPLAERWAALRAEQG